MRSIAPHPHTRIAIEHDYSAKPILTQSEALLHLCLEQMTQGRCRILCKPRLADFIQHPQETGAFQRISQRHVDFLICPNESWVPMLGVELDDPSHESNSAKISDMFKNRLFAHVGIPLVRIHVSEMQRVEEMVKTLSGAWVRRTENLVLESNRPARKWRRGAEAFAPTHFSPRLVGQH